jgi:hypothetical protein
VSIAPFADWAMRGRLAIFVTSDNSATEPQATPLEVTIATREWTTELPPEEVSHAAAAVVPSADITICGSSPYRWSRSAMTVAVLHVATPLTIVADFD